MLYLAHALQRLGFDAVAATLDAFPVWGRANTALLRRSIQRYPKQPFAIPGATEDVVESRPFVELRRFTAAGGPRVLLVAPPFAPRIGQLAALPARQTPLLVVDSTEQQIVLKLRFPKGATLAAPVASRDVADGEYKVLIRDRQEGSDIILDRRIVLPSGRIQVDAYPDFLRFARLADDSLSASVRVRLAKSQ
jgi:hypothetical protein